MKEIKFRNLNPSEIQIRPTDTKFKGTATLLLYQDARCAMDILDATVGPFGWQKKYEEVKGNVYCSIGIKDSETGEWVWKSDCGVESNVDAEKGEASDAAKRAAVCWGIGRELYTGPRIKIKCPDSYYFNDKMNMTFYVKHIAYDGKNITELAIADRFNNIVYNWKVDNGYAQTYTQNTTTAKSFEDEDIVIEQPSKFDNKTIIKDFCTSQKGTGSVDMKQLKAFYNFYTDRADTWKGKMDAPTLFNRWMAHAN